MLSTHEKEFWIFYPPTTTWAKYYEYMIETSSENQLESNFCGSTLMNFFSAGASLSYKDKRMLSDQ